MNYQFIKLIVYVFSICLTFYAFTSVKFDDYVLKGQIKKFYLAYLIGSIVVGYIFGSFILEFVTIHL
ncbi:MAG: DUF1146 domain-containing protein [Thomasclavelia sp.]|jgi:uncharacterized membrane protein YwzB|nr:DUF1146 domain-containing protein [Thomasclavelia sp.]